jgi:DNA-directed RNA polymerase subunit beta
VKPIKRKNYSKIASGIQLPNLLETQTSSFEDFLQAGIPPEKRRNEGLQGVFRELFPIDDPQGRLSLEFVSYGIGKPRYSITECHDRDMTYAAPLKGVLRLAFKDPADPKARPSEVIEKEVFLCEIPLMTGTGTFVINGAERVVVSQLHRSPGVFFAEKTHPSGKRMFTAEIIPYRGSWIKFTLDPHDLLWVSIDKHRKFHATLLLRAVGFATNKQILELFHEPEEISLSGDKQAQGRYLYDDVVAPKTGEVLAEAGKVITPEILATLKLGRIEKVKVVAIDPVKDPAIVPRTMLADNNKGVREDALSKIYSILHPGDAVSPELYKGVIDKMFFDRKRYDLKRVGRYQLNKRLETEGSSSPVLCPDDFVEVLRYLLKLRMNQGVVDDIDHLGNRRVLRVGELIANQFSMAFSRMARMARERMSLWDGQEQITPQELVNSRLISSTVNTFFGSSQLSQFLDEPNPLAELRHKRRLSALGPGGLTRERAGFEVRDVHYTHYGRLCPIETPEGPNIGLIASLACFARINDLGFLETPYRKSKNGKLTGEVDYLSANDEDQYTIAQANTPVEESGKLSSESALCRHRDGFPRVRPEKVDYMDVSPQQLVSLSAALIPFLEHDDANRALMGSNMQCQAVPLLQPEAPVIGTGLEGKAALDSGTMVQCKRDGTVEKVTADAIFVKPSKVDSADVDFLKESQHDIYHLTKFRRSNQDTCINQRPIVKEGDTVRRGEVVADGASTEGGELALGINCLVGFLPWAGYNFEDAIIISERMVTEDKFTSVHIENFECFVRETKRGPEELTREIPNVGEEAVKDLDENGIIRIGARVEASDILVGKVTPKGETEPTPEEKLLRAIFGDKAGDIKDTSLKAPPGMDGIVCDVKVFSRKGTDRRASLEEKRKIEEIQKDGRKRVERIRADRDRRIRELLAGQTCDATIKDGDRLVARKGQRLSEEVLGEIKFEKLPAEDLAAICEDDAVNQRVVRLAESAARAIESVRNDLQIEQEKVEMGDELPPDVIKLVKVFVARKRKLMVGDKLAGRHGNKGVLAKIVPIEDMPYLADGRPLDLILNPLGVPSRMNVGQVLETHLGWAAQLLGFKVATPVFDGATSDEVSAEMKLAGLPDTGKVPLFDGRSGECFDQPVTVGVMYMLKLSHLVDDKIHARSIGPYSLITQQPLGGKAHFGGQRFGEMEVWALESYGAAYTLQEILTVKSDDVQGRQRVYEAIVKGENLPEPGTPASFDVLVKELQGLCLDVQLRKEDENAD